MARCVVLKAERYEGRALVARAHTQNAASMSLLLVKPLTYMNGSGHAVHSLLANQLLALDDILVIHDDINLELGRIRLRPAGTSGGHRGMDSIIKALGTAEYPRLRCGIGRPESGDDDVVQYVLSPFTGQDRDIVETMVEEAVQAALTFVVYGIETAMNKYNRRNGVTS